MTRLSAVAIILLFSYPTFAAHTFNETQSKVVRDYLSIHPSYRLATLEDCKCDEDILNMQKGYSGMSRPVPDYFPYRAAGDFNNDGNEDIAVVLLDRVKTTKPFILVIFNGPFSEAIKPAFEERESHLSYQGLFFGSPRSKPYRLLLGPYESDVGQLLIPKGKTYTWE